MVAVVVHHDLHQKSGSHDAAFEQGVPQRRDDRHAIEGEQIEKVSFHSPDDFISFLQKPAGATSDAPAPSAPTETRRRGYKVRSHFVTVSDEDAKVRKRQPERHYRMAS
jgi:hypothetical protein